MGDEPKKGDTGVIGGKPETPKTQPKLGGSPPIKTATDSEGENSSIDLCIQLTSDDIKVIGLYIRRTDLNIEGYLNAQGEIKTYDFQGYSVQRLDELVQQGYPHIESKDLLRTVMPATVVGYHYLFREREAVYKKIADMHKFFFPES